ncbi:MULTISPECIES: chemotaxis protein CheW [unclassified Nostoc]|uniref:chemotaxis protein CheW n=1 Tax=unclassified Nostoc TaxID=2593658 RepID=UPI002AD52AB0|nr:MULTISPECIES: chemotaxis protein CheW [unclassified Nostoc]MDZ8120646.1 chemotaxis protein CheW [Nostoc sp. CmiVER01]MDZ8227513.1 chemotaxis protein CheW [Nostoc sp. ChiVER01]
MLNTPFPFKRLSGVVSERDSLRVVVFAIADYLFALPVGAVLKVMACPPISSTVENGIGMVDLGAQTITIVDLRQKFIQQVPRQQADQVLSVVETSGRFLLLTQTRTGEICGIPVDKPPALIDIPLSAVRPVPWSYRQVAELSCVSHMAVLSVAPNEEPLKVLLFGMSQILADKLGLPGTTPTLAPGLISGEQRQRFLRFSLGNQGSGLLPFDSIMEIFHLASQEISPAPALPSWILGFYNWQGQMLRLVDLEHLLGYAPLLKRQSPPEKPMVLVLELQNQVIGFLVAHVYDVEWQDLQQAQSAPTDFSPNKLLNLVRGILPGDRWILDTRAIAQTLQWQTH